ncbi:MAG: hypothetical protein JWM31_3366 [Solirubrobacterales bacterium]|nr:hypothetical protein [Solirubrobacterales bacterium]
MFSGPLRLLSIVASLAVLLSFAAFAVDEARSGSQASQAGIARNGQTVAAGDPAGYAKPTPAQEQVRQADHGGARELLDDADDVLMAPFASVSDGSSSAWVRRGFPALLGLAVYGFGLGFLSRFASGRA